MPFIVSGQGRDTLPEIKLKSVKSAGEAESVLPLQRLNAGQLGKLSTQSVAEATKYFSGVLVTDYGGIGGLKTVNVRSLGANHTLLLYDGMPVNDVQAGQIDFGKYSVQNVESIELFNAQPADLLMPAKGFASGAVISLKTAAAKKLLNSEKKMNVSVRAGSFNTFNPSVSLTKSLNKNLQLSFDADWLKSDGDYPYQSYENKDSIAKRSNGKVNSGRLDANITYSFNDSNKISLKGFGYLSHRQLPGPVMLYNDAANESINDKQYFFHASWRKSFSEKNRLLINYKFNNSWMLYLDPDHPNVVGRLENSYLQKESFASAAFQHKWNKSFTTAISSDVIHTSLRRTDIFTFRYPQPKRLQLLNNVSLKYELPLAVLQANMLYTYYKDDVTAGGVPEAKSVFSPTIAGSLIPFPNSPVHFRFFYKHIFRAPTFNDLYYTLVGNTSLRPEYATQYNAGLTYQLFAKQWVKNILFTYDFYISNVKDKILAVPSVNGQWSMRNINKVNTTGMDVSLALTKSIVADVELTSRFSYTFQRALDVSDKNNDYYRQQISYTPVHSGSAVLSVSKNRFEISYNALFSSSRYAPGNVIAENLVRGWIINNMYFSYSQGRKAVTYKYFVELNNFLNHQYQIVKLYPMPGINCRLGVSLSL